MGIALAVFAVLSVIWGRFFYEPAPIAINASGPAAANVVCRPIRGNRFVLTTNDRLLPVDVRQEFVPAAKGWRLAILAMPPQRELRKPGTYTGGLLPSSKPQGALLGWFSDGTPMTGIPTKGVVAMSGLPGSGQALFPTDVGWFRLYLTPVPRGVESGRAHVIPSDADPADITAALACAPPGARWSEDQVATFVTAVAGIELYRGYSFTVSTEQIDFLREKRERAMARIRVALPTLKAIAAGQIPSLTVSTESFSRSDVTKIGLVAPISVPPSPRAQAAWLCAAVDPEAYDAQALRSIDDNATLEDAWLMCRLTGYLPPGAGARLAKRLAERERLGDGGYAAESIWIRPWMSAEGDAFVETLAKTPGKHSYGISQSLSAKKERDARAAPK